MVWCGVIYILCIVGVVTTLAGGFEHFSNTASDGLGTIATFLNPSGITVDRDGIVYVVDYTASNIRRIAPSGMVTSSCKFLYFYVYFGCFTKHFSLL